MHAFSTTTLTGIVFCMMRLFSEAANCFCQQFGCFGICANSAFEEKMEVEMIYFWKDGGFSFTEFTNMLMMFVNRRRCMLQRLSS